MADRESQTEAGRKLEWHLLPFDALEEVVKVLMDGKYTPKVHNDGKPYGANNWREEPYFTEEVLADSALRHLVARMFKKERYDAQSNLLHSAHFAANALFMVYYDLYNLWAQGEIPNVPGASTATDEEKGEIARRHKELDNDLERIEQLREQMRTLTWMKQDDDHL